MWMYKDVKAMMKFGSGPSTDGRVALCLCTGESMSCIYLCGDAWAVALLWGLPCPSLLPGSVSSRAVSLSAPLSPVARD